MAIDIRRREFIVALGGATAWPFAARAQQERRVPRVGYVWIGAPGTDDVNAGLRRGLEDRGYVIGGTLVIEERYANGDAARVPRLIEELLGLKVDVLATPGTLISRAAQRATSTVPIVMLSGDPIGAGLAASLARPGANFGYWEASCLLEVPAAGFLVRLFMIQHDCGHGSFFRYRLAN